MKAAQLEVVYIDHMGSDMSVCNAARQSFGKQKPVDQPLDEKDVSLINFLATGKRTADWDAFLGEIYDLVDLDAYDELKQRLIAYKREAQHWAPFGHPHITLCLRMPIFLARQFVKHQVGGVWSEESRRYMSDEPEFYFEPVWMGRPDDVKQGADGELPSQRIVDGYMRSITARQLNAYTLLLGTEIHRGPLAPEQAREILTLNTMTGVTWTGSLLFWSRVCNQRLDAHAQGAAQSLARMIDQIIEPLFPVSWKALVK